MGDVCGQPERLEAIGKTLTKTLAPQVSAARDAFVRSFHDQPANGLPTLNLALSLASTNWSAMLGTYATALGDFGAKVHHCGVNFEKADTLPNSFTAHAK